MYSLIFFWGCFGWKLTKEGLKDGRFVSKLCQPLPKGLTYISWTIFLATSGLVYKHRRKGFLTACLYCTYPSASNTCDTLSPVLGEPTDFLLPSCMTSAFPPSLLCCWIRSSWGHFFSISTVVVCSTSTQDCRSWSFRVWKMCSEVGDVTCKEKHTHSLIVLNFTSYFWLEFVLCTNQQLTTKTSPTPSSPWSSSFYQSNLVCTLRWCTALGFPACVALTYSAPVPSAGPGSHPPRSTMAWECGYHFGTTVFDKT